MAGARPAPRGDPEPRAGARAAPDRLPEYLDADGSTRPCCPPSLRAAGRARPRARGRWAPGEPATCPSSSAATRPARLKRRARRGRDHAPLEARGAERERVFAAADALRREVCGDEVSYVVTRNIQYTNVCYFRCGFCAFSKGKLAANLRGAPYLVPHEEIVRRCVEAWERGATEVCLQGGIHPAFNGDYYAAVVRAIKDAVPEIHVHAFSRPGGLAGRGHARPAARRVPRAVARRWSRLAPRHGGRGARRRGARRHLPGQDHDRAVARGARDGAPRRPPLEHDDHVRPRRGPRSWARHLLACASSSGRRGGFTEFVPLPFVPMEAPIFLKGRARRGPTFGEALLMHAVGRLALHPVDHEHPGVVGQARPGRASARRSRAGVNDLGGTLMNESISRAAGSEWGQEMPEQMEG